MIEQQREKEFLFELERIYHNYNIVIVSSEKMELLGVDGDNLDDTTTVIENCIDQLRSD